jgi:hypothetical protein
VPPDTLLAATTSTYVETEDPDPPVWRDDHGSDTDTDTDTDTDIEQAGNGVAEGQRSAGRGAGLGSAAAGSPRTPATTVRRSWSGWP